MHMSNMSDSVKDSIDLYVKVGCQPGGFLIAVLSNDLREAFARADQENIAAMFEIVKYCWNEIPSECWGSPEKVNDWLTRDWMAIREAALTEKEL